jgi:hypothetical protein
MMSGKALAKLEKKLTANSASILTDEEVQLLARQVRHALGPELDTSLSGAEIRVEDGVRWASVRASCEQARGARGLGIRDVSVALPAPQYRLKAIEQGVFKELDPKVAWRYFKFLGIQRWMERWARMNDDLARRIGLIRGPGVVNKPSNRGRLRS